MRCRCSVLLLILAFAQQMLEETPKVGQGSDDGQFGGYARVPRDMHRETNVARICVGALLCGGKVR